MSKILIIRWIIMHCDRKTFSGMRWENREKGIFWLYWRHQSSKNCKEDNAGSAELYEYYRAWARHKNNNRRRKPRDLKAAFRNALEKKEELERLKHLETKERIYWRIKNFPNGQNESYAPPQSNDKKPKGGSKRGRKPSNNLVPNNEEFSVNYGASTSSASENVILEQKKMRKPLIKGRRKIKNSLSDEESVYVPYDPTVDTFTESLDVANSQVRLPSIDIFNRTWGDSLKSTDSNLKSEPPHISEASYEKWTPQCYPQSPPQVSTDLMDVPSGMMEPFNPNKLMDYSCQLTPPQEATDILSDNITDEDLVIFGKLINQEEPTKLKYSFTFQTDAVSTNLSNQKNTHPVTLSYCSLPDFASTTKTLNVQSNNVISDSQTTPQAFLFDQKQTTYDQVVPPYSGAFQICEQQAVVSEMFVGESILYSPPPVPTCGQTLVEMCHQQVDTGCYSSELLSYNNQTSLDDSGISDMEMEDFWERTDKLLDAFIPQSEEQSNLMC